MIRLGFELARPLLHACDAETAHRLTIKALRCLPTTRSAQPPNPILQSSLFGLQFANPVGLAAGFDKNGEVPDQMLGLGFGFVEAGTTTPLAQIGNARPRLFRLAEDKGVINRMGFNNDGHAAMLARLQRRRGSGIVGVNIGANKDARDRIADYVAGVTTFGGIADYLTVNVSSPNTPGLRGLQSRGELQSLLARLNEARTNFAKPLPMLLKIAPDLGDAELEDIVTCCEGTVDGVIISNTTISRPSLRSSHAQETGGLSGAPLFDLSTRQLAKFHVMTQGRIPLVGAGGVDSADKAWTKIKAGASLLQLYSALVFQGPKLVEDILQGLVTRTMAAGFHTYRDAIGIDAHHHSGSGK